MDRRVIASVVDKAQTGGDGVEAGQGHVSYCKHPTIAIGKRHDDTHQRVGPTAQNDDGQHGQIEKEIHGDELPHSLKGQSRGKAGESGDDAG